MLFNGEKLRELRLLNALSQRDLAARSTVAYPTISRLETGKEGPPYPSTIRKLARALRVEPSELMVRDTFF